jgi:hypothetical protein
MEVIILNNQEDFNKIIKKFQGKWIGKMSTWFEPNSQEIVESVEGDFKIKLDEKVLLHTYRSKLQETDFEGIHMISFDMQKLVPNCSWIDTMHTSAAMMVCEGRITEGKIIVLGSYEVVDSDPWGWEMEFEILDDKPVITMYNIPPEGEKYVGVKINYQDKN